MANTYWLQDGYEPLNVCFGSGRFLRSVLVPALQESPPVIVQTRGRSFLDHCRGEKTGQSYQVDTVQYDGSIQTDSFRVGGVFSLGVDADAVWNILAPACARSLRIVGVGVTEQGLANAETTAMKDLYRFFQELAKVSSSSPATTRTHPICVINTDNVPWNGRVLQSHMATRAADDPATRTFLSDHVVFLNSMVDRITSHRPDDPDVPRAEPVPAKALVVLDETAALPPCFLHDGLGVVRRSTEQQLQSDLALKLRIANGTHTAVAHVMALCGLARTDALLDNGVLLSYLDAFVHQQVVVAIEDAPTKKEALAVWEDWRARLTHQHFGLCVYFITQNGAAKGGIRFGPTVVDLIRNGQPPVTQSTVFAYAALLRWLTCSTGQQSGSSGGGVYRGKLCRSDANHADTVTYADGLRYNRAAGWYEFRCACLVDGKSITEWLDDDSNGAPRQPEAYKVTIRKYLLAPDGGNLGAVERSSAALDQLVGAIAVLYARMVAGDDPLEILEELHTTGALGKACVSESSIPKHGAPLHFNPHGQDLIPDHCSLMELPMTVEWLNDAVAHEVASMAVVDLHTHLLPPSHGPLCLWGIDELLTYHYLVAEFFMTAPPEMTPEVFYAKTKQAQADLVWKSLFLDRSPLSEATRGVVTTLTALGLTNEVQARDLEAIRRYYRRWRDSEDGASGFSRMVHDLSGVRYNVMTNIPFDPNEAQHWHQKKPLTEHYRTALRVDPFLSGDRAAVQTALRVSGYDDTSLESARQFLRDWIDILKPEYAMASTPHDFGKSTRRASVNLEAMREPGAFAQVLIGTDGCNDEKDDDPTQIDETSDLFGEVLVKVCEERGLPIALKIGAHRQVNPRLRQAGDGLVAFADAGMLGRLCTTYPKIRFLATFLSRHNQQEACVLASKFNNLHIYGCWWYCFTPSMVREITQMRIEMLGTAFTAQHSDARVLDQLIYKWAHSRSAIALVLLEEVAKLCLSGWSPSRAEIRRDVRRLLGGSYETFIAPVGPSVR